MVLWLAIPMSCRCFFLSLSLCIGDVNIEVVCFFSTLLAVLSALIINYGGTKFMTLLGAKFLAISYYRI